MKLAMKSVRIVSIPELEQLVAGITSLQFHSVDKTESYDWIAKVLQGYRYRTLGKHERGVVTSYIGTLTGYSKRQTERLIACFLKTTKLQRKAYQHHSFSGTYTREDCILLATTDAAHDVLSGPATRKILEREYVMYGKPAYERLAGISVSHIYNLRKTYLYHQHIAVFKETLK